VPDGRRMMDYLASHHYVLMTGHHLENIELISRVFELEIDSLS
jgi:hypothetical protein